MIEFSGYDAWLMLLEFTLMGLVCGLIIGYSFNCKKKEVNHNG